MWTAAPLVLLAAVALAAYANAWPNALVHDDKFFAGSERFAELSNIPRYFTESAWASSGAEAGLYRPLLLTSITLDARLWGDFVAGYHLSNIFLHGAVTLLVYGFLLQLLSRTNRQSGSDSQYALLAALLFAVHPVNTEVVNSVFNRSEMLVALGGLSGLLWFLRHMDSGPAKAWTGLGLAYFLVLFCKESAIVLPGLAVLLMLTLSRDNTSTRLKKCLPVFWLLAPLILYLGLRAHALAPVESTGMAESVGTLNPHGGSGALRGIEFPDWERLMHFAGFVLESLKIWLWPVPLRIQYEAVSRASEYVGLAVHPALLLTALYLSRQKHHGPIIGLAFFYLALLPASRIAGEAGLPPHVAERYLYFPSVGLLIMAAFGLRSLARKYSVLPAVSLVILGLILLTPVTWARNHAWRSEVELFESEYRQGNTTNLVLVWLTAAHLANSDFQRAVELCDQNGTRRKKSGRLSVNCAAAYGRVGRVEESERSYLDATAHEEVRAIAHANLARLFLRQNRWQDAKRHFELAVEAESLPANKAFRRGHMLVRLYPDDREKLLEAKRQFEYALELQPAFAPARYWLQRVDRALGSED